MHFSQRSRQLIDNSDTVRASPPFAYRHGRATIQFACAFLGFVLLLRTRAAFAQTVTLAGNHLGGGASLTTSAAPGLPLTIRIYFALRNRGELQQLLADQQNPASPRYHRWLTPSQFDRRFGRTRAEVRAVGDWLQAQGFQLGQQSLRSITATGTAVVAEAAFNTALAASPDNLRYANVSDPEIPARFGHLIGSIEGLSNTARAVPLMRIAPHNFSVLAPAAALDAADAVEGLSAIGPIPIYSNGDGVGFGPQDLYTFYDEAPLENSGTDGSGGDCIALPETSDYLSSAVSLFDTTFALPAANITEVFPDGHDPGIGPAGTETLIDVEWAHTVAPGAPITVYVGAGATALQDAIERAVSDDTCGAISISYEYCDTSSSFFTGTLDPIFAQAAAQGQSVFVASGDTGAAGIAEPAGAIGCSTGTSQNVSEMAADPNVTSVGGSEFVPDYDADDNDIGFVPETVWNDPSGSAAGASGGGASTIFSKPAYQLASTPADGARDVPDVAFAASAINPGFYLGYDSGGSAALECCVGGTSVAAPMWAGLIKLISQSYGRLGNVDQILYQLGPLGGSVGIRDVTAGNNSFNGVTGFNAVPGYDQATGWGSADITTLVNSWSIAAATPSSTPSSTPTPVPTAAPSSSPTPAPSPSPTPSPTATASSTPAPSPTPTPTPSASPVQTPAPSPSPSPTPTLAATPSPSPTPNGPPAAPTLSSASINFGEVVINSASQPRTVTITNPGFSRAPLVMSGLTVSSPFVIFTSSTTCTSGESLTPNSSCAIVIEFEPASTGTISGTLSISDNADSSPQRVSLTGVGEE
ncbi:MAG TPA: protease pro-enzyme activation domain-containing protein [Candidatus Binataceae bacterium]|nr:protease pro-enzyme activation domain-containing protein [Candidatus Binataceae bacterium]